jgi:hypothetical protein
MATEMDKGPVEVPTVTIVHKETISNPNPTRPCIELAGPYPNFGMWGPRDYLTLSKPPPPKKKEEEEENVDFLKKNNCVRRRNEKPASVHLFTYINIMF